MAVKRVSVRWVLSLFLALSLSLSLSRSLSLPLSLHLSPSLSRSLSLKKRRRQACFLSYAVISATVLQVQPEEEGPGRGCAGESAGSARGDVDVWRVAVRVPAAAGGAGKRKESAETARARSVKREHARPSARRLVPEEIDVPRQCLPASRHRSLSPTLSSRELPAAVYIERYAGTRPCHQRPGSRSARRLVPKKRSCVHFPNCCHELAVLRCLTEHSVEAHAARKPRVVGAGPDRAVAHTGRLHLRPWLHGKSAASCIPPTTSHRS